MSGFVRVGLQAVKFKVGCEGEGKGGKGGGRQVCGEGGSCSAQHIEASRT